MTELSVAVDRIVSGTRHWTPAAWSASPPAGGLPLSGPGDGSSRAGTASRADMVHRLVQRLADLAADAESVPRRAVPRLDNDLALPDQLRVVTADLLDAAPPEPVRVAAHAAVDDTRHALWQ